MVKIEITWCFRLDKIELMIWTEGFDPKDFGCIVL